jgi:hypothetical protein
VVSSVYFTKILYAFVYTCSIPDPSRPNSIWRRLEVMAPHRAGRPEIDSWYVQVSSPHADRLKPTQPLICGYHGIFPPGVNRQEREAHRSLPANTEGCSTEEL